MNDKNRTSIQHARAQAQRIEHTFDWGRVVWHVWGAGSGKPRLVLLHGGSGSWTHWVRNVLHLAQRYEVWAIDIPGFGDSDLPPQAQDADDLVPFVHEALVRALGDAPLTVIGFSFGGMLAGLIAAEYPERIARLVLVGVPGLGLFARETRLLGLRPDMDVAQQRAMHRHNLAAMMLSDPEGIDEALLDLQQHNIARDRLRRRRIARTDVLVRAQTRWRCTVDGIWGGRDALYLHTLDQVPRVLPSLRSFKVVPGAGHWVQYEAPEAFHAIVDGLL